MNCEYSQENEEQKKEDDEKCVLMNQLCEKHYQHKNMLFKKKQFGDILTEKDIVEEFVRSLPLRSSIKLAIKHCQPYDLKPFVVRLIQSQLDNRSPVDNLNEGREVTIQYINFATSPKCNFVKVLDDIYKKVHDIISQYLGVLIEVSILDKDVTMLVVYGTKPCRQEVESKNALVSSNKINEAVTDVANITLISIGNHFLFIYLLIN